MMHMQQHDEILKLNLFSITKCHIKIQKKMDNSIYSKSK
jgi:hypothetical protein